MLGDADPLLAARRRRADGLASRPASSSPRCEFAPQREAESYRLGVLHGLVFGDGAWNKQEIRSGEHLHYVQLYGDRVGARSGTSSTRSTSRPASTSIRLRRNRRRSRAGEPQALAARDADPEYIAGFADGWLAADGDPVQGRFVASAVDRPRGARLARGGGALRRLRRRRLRRGGEPSRRTSASAAGRSGGSISRHARRPGA